MNRQQKKQLGFTLVEVMIVMAIIGAAVGGVLYYQARAENTQTATKTASDIALLASKTKTYFRPSNSYTGVSASSLNGMALVTAPMKYSGTDMVDPWGNTMSVGGGTLSFALSLGGATAPIDREVCTNLVTSLSDKATAIRVGTGAAVSTSGPTAGTIGGGNLYKGGTTAADAAALATGCNEVSPVIAMQFN